MHPLRLCSNAYFNQYSSVTSPPFHCCSLTWGWEFLAPWHRDPVQPFLPLNTEVSDKFSLSCAHMTQSFLVKLPFCGSAGKESSRNAGDLSSILGLGRSPGEGNGYPLQYSGLENSMNCIIHGVAELDTTEQLSLALSLASFFFRTFLSPPLRSLCPCMWVSDPTPVPGNCISNITVDLPVLDIS